MALRTQVDPYILIGDSLADLPLPGAIAQGTLFHEEATGTCRVLVINPITGLRTWEDFCGGGGSGATGATGPTGPAGTALGALLKFSNLVPVNVEGVFSPSFMSDAGNALVGPDNPQNYPMPAAGTLVGLAAFLDSATPLGAGSTLTVEVRVNLAPTGLVIVFDGDTTPSGFQLAAGLVPVVAGDTVDILVTPGGQFVAQVRLAATVQVV